MFKVPSAFALLLLLSLRNYSAAFLVSVAEDQELEVISNPHDTKQGCQGALLDRLLEPNQLILQPMPTQADTFQELTYAKVLTVPVPIYTMKQPARLSAAQFEFQLVAVKELSGQASNTIQEVPFPMERAMDSWFPGYYWKPLAMKCGENNWQHVGWKFTSLEGNNNNKFSHFYALMVQTDKKQKTEALRVGGFKAPGWMVAAILS